jgi:iron complex outermembrane receptor protein
MDNDQANTQRRIPARRHRRLEAERAYEHFFWSLSVNNLFNALYYDYAIASSFHAGPLRAYPLPAGPTW